MIRKTIELYPGVAWGGRYIDLTDADDGTAVALTTYEVQLQFRDAADASLLATASISNDGSVDGRIWPSLTGTQTTAVLAGTTPVFGLLFRPIDQSHPAFLIAHGFVRDLSEVTGSGGFAWS